MPCIHYTRICVFTMAPPSWWLDISIRPLLWCEGIWAGLVINVHQGHVFQSELGSQQRWEHYATSQAKTNYTAIWCSETLTISPDLPLAPQGESVGGGGWRPQQCDMTHVVHTHTLCVWVCETVTDGLGNGIVRTAVQLCAIQLLSRFFSFPSLDPFLSLFCPLTPQCHRQRGTRAYCVGASGLLQHRPLLGDSHHTGLGDNTR